MPTQTYDYTFVDKSRRRQAMMVGVISLDAASSKIMLKRFRVKKAAARAFVVRCRLPLARRYVRDNAPSKRNKCRFDGCPAELRSERCGARDASHHGGKQRALGVYCRYRHNRAHIKRGEREADVRGRRRHRRSSWRHAKKRRR